MLQPGFWDDLEHSRQLNQQLAGLKDRVARFASLESALQDLEVMLELCQEEQDPLLEEELTAGLEDLARRLADTELEVLLAGPYDRNDAILSLHPGAGGTESQDWAQMLLRMYTRYCENHNYKVEVLDLLPGDEAGIKSATIQVAGPNAYGYLKCEKGVHRLVRISPFDAAGRRHTSFASVDVLPVVEEEVEVQIRPEDLKIDTYRSGGAGGQHVNKTDSAVRITHLPTGIVVACQNERSQTYNRMAAMKLLKAKLIDLELRKKEEELAALRGEQKDIAWGNQIRSYVFHPYSLVKDHRTGVETGNVQAVMDGRIEEFIAACLKQKANR
ncbi:Peptide chain release factor 2 [Desulforamulus hydrothermalis Lam5 = DSM 18033]|uniref:Peptide chain release factor 2 n=2 Tax=Desulforamulus TaxID=2916693 RepID=K8E7V5_9FIRM|nr:Peptide chain release factor 2 [Desulforamulus hydrothermalis Lam5 = DSM 18033]SHH20342.1 bacterial peptide chain release factor 2 (bRF-2) [Desulforamulus hydrothermalis Lam5 = DSM 18033]